MCLTVVPVPSPNTSARRVRGLTSRLLVRGVVTSLVAILAVVLPPAAPPSGASSVYLCSGYTSCANAGYGNAGYAARSNQMYWRMYSGHNCTNYIAYRMIRAGMSTERPWSGGSGNAYYWGYAMDDITDRTPAVGAVAWWDRGVPGAGSSGHVAYVEKVVSSTEIVISEDSWSGDFHWRRIYKSGSGWPTGFIHFVDKKTLKNTTRPWITGTPQVGVRLRGYKGGFKPGARQTLQWYAGGVAVPGATTNYFTPTAAHVGKAVTMRTTAARSGFVGTTVMSAATAPVAEGVFGRGAPPAITGSPEVGQVLTATRGTWSPAPASTSFQWKADGVRLEGFTTSKLTLTNAMVGKRITVIEKPVRPGYKKILGVSAPFGPVVEGTVRLTAPFAVSGAPRYGSTLTYTAGTYTPSDATISYQWLRDGVVVPGASAATYKLAAADVGHRIVARATLSKPRYRSVVTSADAGLVTTPSTVTVTPVGRSRAAVVKVRVAAAGLATRPGGIVTVTIGRQTDQARLVDGRVRIRLADLGKGKRVVRVSYSGTDVVEPRRAWARVWVRR